MYKILIALVGLMTMTQAGAETQCKADEIQKVLPGVEEASVGDSPVNGLCEISIGPQVVYVSPDAKFLVRGDVIELATNLNLTDRRRAVARAQALDGLTNEDMIVFAPENVKHKITVFTDIDCGYCRKLHREMAQLHERGIQVQYLFFPRSGPGTESWNKAQQVWCSKDRNDALTRAKNGEALQNDACEANPVSDHYAMGQMVGLRGTPAIVTETGDLISGYLPADALLARLDSTTKVAVSD